MASYSKTINIGKTGYLYLHLYKREWERGYRFKYEKYTNQRSYFWKPEIKEVNVQIGVWAFKAQWKHFMV